MTHCTPNPKRHRDYQLQARESVQGFTGEHVPPLHRFAWTCETNWCLTVEHLEEHQPKRLNYPSNVCIYCGLPGYTKDHLVPRPWSGDAERKFVATVPACGECNSMIGDTVAPTIRERREIAHQRIERKYRKFLNMPEHDLSEYGPSLRAFLEQSLRTRDYIRERLAWPSDPFYDARALETSDLECDPYAVLGA